MINKFKNKKCAFSLLEKPLRSNRLFAMLTQSLTRFCRFIGTLPRKTRTKFSLTIDLSHTKFRSPAAHSSGFSLAEAMIMLAIVAVLMGLFAPLIAKKSANDLKNLQYPILPNNEGQILHNAANAPTGNRFTSAFGALGNLQNFGIGTSTPNAKLHILGAINNADILNVTAGALHTADAADAANDKGLFVRQRTVNVGGANRQIAEVNIVACVPNWGQIGNIPLDGSNNFTQDGYLVVNRCATVGSEGNAKTFCSEIIPHSIACADGTCNAINDYVFNSPTIVPVDSGTAYSNVEYSGITLNAPPPENQFIPCRQGYKSYGRNEDYVSP